MDISSIPTQLIAICSVASDVFATSGSCVVDNFTSLHYYLLNDTLYRIIYVLSGEVMLFYSLGLATRLVSLLVLTLMLSWLTYGAL